MPIPGQPVYPPAGWGIGNEFFNVVRQNQNRQDLAYPVDQTLSQEP